MSLEENNVKFIFNTKTLINNYSNYKEIGDIYYPLKTNSNEKIISSLESIYNVNDGYLISNLNHFKILTSMGISPSKICLINVLSEKETVKYLYDNGVRFFIFDNMKSLMDYSLYANFSESKIAIRLNTMEVFDDTLMHLGASTKECIEMLSFLKEKCQSIGISFYLQTKIKDEVGAFEKMLNYIQMNFNNMNISFINMAGLKNYNEINKDYLINFKKNMNLKQIILEPGKYLVGNTMDMVTKIIRIKKLSNKTILIIKNGLYSGFLDVLLYKEKFNLSIKLDDNKLLPLDYDMNDQSNYEIYMCGGSSDSGDVIGTMYINKNILDNIKINQEIIVKNVGAYFEEFFMNYGGDIEKVTLEVDENEI